MGDDFIKKNVIYVFCIICMLCLSACVNNSVDQPDSTPSAVVSILPEGSPESTKTTEAETETPKSTTPSPTETDTQEPTGEPTEELTETEIPNDNGYTGLYTDIELDLPDNPNNPYFTDYGSPITAENVLSNERLSWSFGINDDFQPPTAQKKFDIRLFNGYYLGDVSNRELYLTFDEGYENGFTSSILDTLKEKEVKAAFFVTKSYVKSNLDLVMRMIDEGHIVASHSVNHLSSPTLTDSEMEYEITELAEYFKSVTGRDIAPYFRPPMGEYSARTLDITDRLGYKTIFWSFAYRDWETDNQPGIEKAFDMTVGHVHNGAIILLHAVSESNTVALPYILDTLKNNGFEFKMLDDLPDYGD